MPKIRGVRVIVRNISGLWNYVESVLINQVFL